MFHIYNIFLLSLFFTYSISNNIQSRSSNRTITSSRSIYDLVQIRRAAARLAAYYNKSRYYNHTNNNKQLNMNFLYTNTSNNKVIISKNNRNRFLMERLKIIVVISSITMGFMILIVILCIVIRYCRSTIPKSTRSIEQIQPLNSPRNKISRTTYYDSPSDTRNFSRKTRTLPVTA